MIRKTACTIIAILVGLILLFSSPVYSQSLVLYDAPEGATSAPDFELFVNGKKTFVYNTRSAAFANFSFSGKVDIRIVSGAVVHSVDVRPLSLGIPFKGQDNEVRFSLDKPCNISVEINRNIKRPLFLFASPLEKNVPDSNSKGVLYYGAGRIHTPGIVRVGSDQTVYIAGGAIVKGSFIVDKASHVRFAGRGIIDNAHYQKGEARPIEINGSAEVRVEDIIFAESRSWTCGSYASRNVVYDNIKVVSDNDWDDGVDIVGSRNITVQNCFIRSKDDCIAIKSGVDYFNTFTSFTVDSILIRNCTLWNGIWGNSLEIGFETRTDTIRNIVFRDCDLIHVEGPEGTLTIHNGDRALVQNVLYENLVVEDTRGLLIDFKILHSQYSIDTIRGHIDNIRLKNIKVLGNYSPKSIFQAFDKDHTISNVLIENLTIQGKKINSSYSGLTTSSFVRNIRIK